MRAIGQWLTVMALSMGSAAATTADWQPQINLKGERSTAGAGVAQLGETRTAAQLTLRCTPGNDGTVSWSLAIDSAGSLGFDFAPFEGPDAPALKQRLSELSLAGGLLRPRFDTAVVGFFDGADRFVVQFSAAATAASDAALLADSIGTQTTTLYWAISDFDQPTKKLEVEVPLQDASAGVRETMMGCGPAPLLGEAERSAWRGRNPIGIDLFEHRAVQWRLKGLLGRQYDAVITRMRSAQPVGIDRDTVFVIAPDPDANDTGVALMLSTSDSEIVLVDEGKVSRVASRKGALVIPRAIREFVAQRTAAKSAPSKETPDASPSDAHPDADPER